MAHTSDKPNLHTLPAELLRWTSSFLDSSSALALSTVHSGTQLAAERQLWTSLYVSLPPQYGQHPWDESSNYPNTFNPGLARQYAIRKRVQGILEVLRTDPAKRLLVKDLYLEVDDMSAPDMIDLLASVSGQLECLSICPRKVEASPPRNKVSKALEFVRAQAFHDLLALQDIRFEKLTTLVFKDRTRYYLFNLQRILERCPNLINLTIKGGSKMQTSVQVGVLPALPKLESLTISGTRLEPIEFIDDILANNIRLKHLCIADESYSAFDRNHSPDSIPIGIPLEPITARLRSCTTLKSLHWKFGGISLIDMMHMDEDESANFRTVEKVWMASRIYAAPMARLEFLDIPPLPYLKELHILSWKMCKNVTRTQRSGMNRRFLLGSDTSPDGFLPRILNSIRQSPRLESIHLPDFGSASTDDDKTSHNKVIGDNHAGALIRSYIHETHGELLLVRLHTKSTEFVESSSEAFAPRRAAASPASSVSSNQGNPPVTLPAFSQGRNSQPVIQHLVSLGLSQSAAIYAPVPRWMATNVNVSAYGPSIGNAVVHANYGSGSNSLPITFNQHGPIQSATPIISPTPPVTSQDNANATSSTTTTALPDQAQEVIVAPTLPPPSQAAPSANQSPYSPTEQTHSASASNDSPTPPLPEWQNNTATTADPGASNTALSAAPSTPQALQSTPPTNSSPPPEDLVSSRPVSPPPISSIGTNWARHHKLLHPPQNTPMPNPHASAVVPFGGVVLPSTQSSSATPSPPAPVPSAPAETSFANSNPADDSASTTRAPPTSQSGPTPPEPSFEKLARSHLSSLPTYKRHPDRDYPPAKTFLLYSRDSAQSKPTVLFDTNATRLYYTPPDYPFPPYTPPDLTYDRQEMRVRSFVVAKWHWEEYVMFNGRILDAETVKKWKAVAAVEEEWTVPGRGLTMSDEAWGLLAEWEKGCEAAWEEHRDSMLRRRRAERAEEMAKLGREVKGKSRATLIDETLPPPPPPPLVINEGQDLHTDHGEDPSEVEKQAAREMEERLKERRKWIEFAVSQDEAGPSRYHTLDTTMEESPKE